jgi:hypothetical protein
VLQHLLERHPIKIPLPVVEHRMHRWKGRHEMLEKIRMHASKRHLVLLEHVLKMIARPRLGCKVIHYIRVSLVRCLGRVLWRDPRPLHDVSRALRGIAEIIAIGRPLRPRVRLILLPRGRRLV